MESNFEKGQFPYSGAETKAAGTDKVKFGENYDIDNVDLTKDQEGRIRALMAKDTNLNFEQATIQILKEDHVKKED